MLKDFAKKSDLKDIMTRLDSLEHEQTNLSDKLKDTDKKTHRLAHKHKKWKPKWLEMLANLNELNNNMKNKVDMTYMNEELDRIKNLIN